MSAFDAYVRALSVYKNEETRLKNEHLARQVARQAELRKKWDWWDKLPGFEFEKELAQLLERLGYKVELTPASNDGGIDLVLSRHSQLPILVQCKAHRTAIGVGVLREFYGAILHYKRKQRFAEAWIVAKAGYTEGATNFARGKPIRLRDIREFLQ